MPKDIIYRPDISPERPFKLDRVWYDHLDILAMGLDLQLLEDAIEKYDLDSEGLDNRVVDWTPAE